jgi:hypothetical protein
MKFKVEIVEKVKAIVEVRARSVTEALRKVERQYYEDEIDEFELEEFELTANINEDMKVRKKTISKGEC